MARGRPANRHGRGPGGGGGGGGGGEIGGIIERAQRLRERMTHSLEADTAAVASGMGGGVMMGGTGTMGLPPSLDPGLIIDSTLGRGGAQLGGGFDALGQLFFDKRPAESAGTGGPRARGCHPPAHRRLCR